MVAVLALLLVLSLLHHHFMFFESHRVLLSLSLHLIPVNVDSEMQLYLLGDLNNNIGFYPVILIIKLINSFSLCNKKLLRIKHFLQINI